MTDEKKTVRGGLTPEQKDAALDDAVLEAVSGGEKKLSLNYWAEKAQDDLAVWANLHLDNDMEQQP